MELHLRCGNGITNRVRLKQNINTFHSNITCTKFHCLATYTGGSFYVKTQRNSVQSDLNFDIHFVIYYEEEKRYLINACAFLITTNLIFS